MSFDRRQGIGASEAGAVLGLSPFATPTDVWLSKTGDEPVVLGMDSMSPAQEWGHRLEPVILEKYGEVVGVEVSTGWDTKMHPGNVPVFATPDGLGRKLPFDGMVDAKSTTHEEGWGEPGTDEVPEHYLVQAVIQMAVWDRPWCDFAVLFLNRRRFAIYRVERDIYLERLVRQRLRKWWDDHVETRTPPDPGDPGYLKQLKSNGSTIVPADIFDELLLVELEVAQREKKEAEAKYENCMNAVKRRIGDYDGIEVKTLGRATWKTGKTGRRTFRTSWEKT